MYFLRALVNIKVLRFEKAYFPAIDVARSQILTIFNLQEAAKIGQVDTLKAAFKSVKML